MSNLIFLLFFLSTSSSFSYVNTSPKCSVAETHALLLFKQNLSSINFSIDDLFHIPVCEGWLGSGYNPIMMNWNTSTDCCDWNGVTCDHLTGDVIGLDLSCGMLQGTIHPNTTLFHLPNLQRLNLAYNDFTDSQLSSLISGFSNSLTHLNLSWCQFTGHVPNDISHLHKLVSLDLSRNSLNLEPHVLIHLLQNLTVMEELSLESVIISSSLPANLNISSSSSLKLLNLGSTGLQGKLPPNMFKLQSLEKLDLSGNSFTGYIPSEISLLIKLTSLDLTGSYGIDNLSIQPHILSNLLQNFTSLRDLRLAAVNIGWFLPTYLNISSPIRSLDLRSTNLQGKLPDYILNLEYLEELLLGENINLCGPLPEVNTTTSLPLSWLYLSGTSLYGEIPNSIGHLKSLVHLFLSDCGFNGSLPESLSDLKHLQYLILSSNELSGTLPSSLFTLPSLIVIMLSNNMFRGNIPLEMFTIQSLQLLHLEELDLSFNKLSGTLPSSLFTLPSLRSIWLSNNMFRGNIPLELFSLQSLEELCLDNNELTGQIDVLGHGPIGQTFQQLTNLLILDLSNNNFRGEWELDTLLSNLTNLEELSLSYSGISVSTNNANHYVSPDFRILSLASCGLKVFPDWLRKIGGDQMQLLDLSINSITGTIPDVYARWGQLEGFLLNGNLLEGKVPISLHKCHNLKVIDLGNNHLNDTFPSWLEDLPFLQALVLRSNNLYGEIVPSSVIRFPFPSLRVLVLSHNRFVGHLPTKYFQNFNAMKNVEKRNTPPEYLSISNKYYSIIVAVKGVVQDFSKLLVEYTIVDLSSNKFEGEIPNIIGNLNSLIALNLSHNSLTGRIPEAIGYISEIESLDLSWNQLTGEIPHRLADLMSLEVLNLSQNHLMGRIPHEKQFYTFGVTSFGGNPKLCGLPLPKECNEQQHPGGDDDDDGDDDDMSGFTWKVVMLGFGFGTLLGFVFGYFMSSTGKPKWFIAIADTVEHMILKNQIKRR